MPVPAERDELLRRRLAVFIRSLRGVKVGKVRALKRTRVASRRLRELIPILQVDARVGRALGRRLRRVTRRLGPVRELDALMLVLDELHESGRYDRRCLSRIVSAIRQERIEAREQFLSTLRIEELGRVAAKLERVAGELATRRNRTAEAGNTRQAWRRVIAARLGGRAARLTAAIRRAGSRYVPDRLHTVRIAAKKLRYVLELATESAGAKTSPDLAQLKRVQKLLGRWHDRQVLIDRVRQIHASLTRPSPESSIELDVIVEALENDCRRLHSRYLGARAALAAVCDGATARSRARRPGRSGAAAQLRTARAR